MSYLGFFGLEFEKNIVIFEISTLEFVELIKFAEKTEKPKFRRKKALFGYFWNIILKTIVIFEINTLKFVYLQNFMKNPKRINLEPKMPDLGIFDQKCLIWLLLGKKYEKTILVFQISTLKFVYFQLFIKKQNCLKLGPRMPDLGILVLEF